MDLSILDRCIVAKPRTRPHYTLAELLTQCDPSAQMTDEEQGWVASEPIGEEVV